MINAAGVALIKQFEGCRLKPYLDLAGVLTAGYGHTGNDVRADQPWSQKKADAVLVDDIAQRVPAVLAACKVEPNENQLAAMVSLAYNIGMGWEGKSRPTNARDGFRQSTVLRLHNQSNFAGAANAFTMWNKAGGAVRAGLTRRRAAEMALYLTPALDEVQTTRGTPDAAKDPATSGISPSAIAVGAGAALTGAQQAVAQVSTIWDGLAELGISPHLVMSVLGLAAVAGLAYFLFERYQRHKEGDR
tara:strand:+ start:234 stop:971 length:738 start_codon:yes stop_codon:yes gene_type:complete